MPISWFKRKIQEHKARKAIRELESDEEKQWQEEINKNHKQWEKEEIKKSLISLRKIRKNHLEKISSNAPWVYDKIKNRKNLDFKELNEIEKISNRFGELVKEKSKLWEKETELTERLRKMNNHEIRAKSKEQIELINIQARLQRIWEQLNELKKPFER